MTEYNKQNQLVAVKRLLSEDKTEMGLRQADQFISKKFLVRDFSLLIKKTLIKKKIIDKFPSISKLENLIQNKQFTCAKYYIKHNSKYLPKNSKTFFLLAKVFSELEDFDTAQEYFEAAIKLDPDNLKFRKVIAAFYMVIGKLDKAIQNFIFIKEKDQLDGENHRLLSRSKNYTNTNDNHILEMEKLISENNLNQEQKINIYFALGNVYENLKFYKKSAEFYKKANLEQNKRLFFDYKKEKHIIKTITTVFNKEKIKQIQLLNKLQNKRPIFILGMPRSGTSLVEQIISSHSDVYGGGELSFTEDYLLKNRGLIGLRMPEILANPSEEKIKEFYNFYSERIDYINNSKKHITDKMPGNFKWIGLLKCVFPNSKIIHVTRDKKDTCFSIYKSYFANDTCSYAYRPENIVKFYNLYTESMRKWKNIFYDEILDCNYEDLVRNTERVSRKLLDFCEVKWDENVLNFYNNRRRVLTVSATQIRKKVYNSSINSWKNFESDLGHHFQNII